MNTPVDFTNLMLVLVWLADKAGAAMWMITWSTLLRNIRNNDAKTLSFPPFRWLKEWMEDPDHPARKGPDSSFMLNLIGCFAPPLVAYVVLQFVPVEWLVAAQPVFAFLVGMILVYIMNQVWYQFTKEGTDGSVIAQSILQTGPVTNTGGLDELRPEPGEPSFDRKVLDLRGTPGVTTTELDVMEEFGERRPVGEPMGRVFSFQTAHQREIRRNRDAALARNLAQSARWLERQIS